MMCHIIKNIEHLKYYKFIFNKIIIEFYSVLSSIMFLWTEIAYHKTLDIMKSVYIFMKVSWN